MAASNESTLSEAEEQGTDPEFSERDAVPFRRKNPKGQGPQNTKAMFDTWFPPDFGEHRRARIGASIVEQFVAGHGASDVLRELVQNEYDAGGDRVTITFGENALEVTGNGRGIGSDGWKRLSVIVGTGRVVGEDGDERVLPKVNGIGSKNFGLRALFLFGDQIYVRSGGYVAILELPTLETGRVQDTEGWGGRGIRVIVPYRRRAFEKLEPFTAKEEDRVFEAMAGGMFSTLVKLALVGRKQGLRELVLRSIRNRRMLIWKQKAEPVPCRMRGLSVIRRTGRLIDHRGDGIKNSQRFEELEFVRSVSCPDEYSAMNYPDYYRKARGMIAIGVSLPIIRGRIDFARAGNFYYPLQTPGSRTGFPLSVSAPFDLNSDRSSLLENSWNSWLLSQATLLTIDLLKEDWFRRFGADGYKAIVANGSATPSQFADAITRQLSEENCWPTRSTKLPERLAKASSMVQPEDVLLDGFLDDSRYLHPAIGANEEVIALAIKSGMDRFTIPSLVRLRCAGENRKDLQTKLEKGEADYHFEDYAAVLSNSDRQAKMASALTALARHVSKANRIDLRSTPSTLTAAGQLRPAKDLLRVSPDIWEVCPEPLMNRLHPALVSIRAISSLCQSFDEQDWLVNAAGRAQDGTIEDVERHALYAKILSEKDKISRRALLALRGSPVALNHRGEWTAPSDMVLLKGFQAKLMASVVNLPSKELIAHPTALARLRIRDRLSADDILACATTISERPLKAPLFESLLNDSPRLLSATLVEKLINIPFLRARSGLLASPSNLHLDTPANRLCLEDDSRIIGGRNHSLYRRLGISEHPSLETLLATLATGRERSAAPLRPDLLYPALASAVGRSRFVRDSLADKPILWVGSAYQSPQDVLVGAHIPRLFDEAVPVLRRTDVLSQAYIALGAHTQPLDEHWIRFFEHVSATLGSSQTVSARERRMLMEAYRQRGHASLPVDLNEDTRCLLDREDRLFSLSDLRAGTLVENDYPSLADSLKAAGTQIGIVDITERSRAFFHGLGIRPLTFLAGAGALAFGAPTPPPLWFKSHHDDLFIRTLRRPLFSKSLHALAVRQQPALPGFRAVEARELQRRISDIDRIDFLEVIYREYQVGNQIARVSVEAAVQDEAIGLVKPRTKLDLQQLVAQALAEVAGATNVAQARTLSTAFLPLVLCRTANDMRVYLERMGVDIRNWSDDHDDPSAEEENAAEDTGEEILRQLTQGLNVIGREPEGSTSDSTRRAGLPSATTTPVSPTTLPHHVAPSLSLPDLSEVRMSLIAVNDHQLQSRRSQGGLPAASRGWTPRSPAEVKRDTEIGHRGEELVFRMELERVRALGHERPEELVIWTSQADAGADHDIKSVDEEGRPRWIEVKSTTGTDGRFEWSRKEFEKALREGKHYELWRVYQAATTTPVAKRFVNPAGLLGASRLILQLGSLRAYIEDLH